MIYFQFEEGFWFKFYQQYVGQSYVPLTSISLEPGSALHKFLPVSQDPIWGGLVSDSELGVAKGPWSEYRPWEITDL